MAVEKWAPGSGQGLTWGAAFNAADLNSMATARAVLSSVADIANGSVLDMYADVSVNLGSITPVSPNFMSLFLYPLNSDAATYGDNQFVAGTASVNLPGANYWVGNITFSVATQPVHGMVSRILLPPGSFRFVLQSFAGAALAASGNSIMYRTYNRQVA